MEARSVGSSIRAWLPVMLLAAVVAAPVAADHDTAVVRCELDIGFVLDRSASMTGGRIGLLQTAATEVVEALGTLDLSGARAFPPSSLDKAVDADHGGTQDVVDLLANGAGDDMADAVADVHADLVAAARPVPRQVMVILSDGHVADPSVAVDAAKADGIEVFTIAIGAGADTGLMASLATTAAVPHAQVAEDDHTAELAGYRVLRALADCLPVVDLGWAPAPACAGAVVTFTDASVPYGGSPIEHAHWDFGDGRHHDASRWSSGMTVRHTYDAPGTYDVRLEVHDKHGRENATQRSVRVIDCNELGIRADFDCRPSYSPPRHVAFTDRSSGLAPPVEHTWHLDGRTITGGLDGFVFNGPGVHIVRLRVADAEGNVFDVTRPCVARDLHPPALEPLQDLEVHAGDEVRVVLQAHDPDGDALVYDLQRPAGLPTNARLDRHVFTWATVAGQEGRYGPLDFGVSDGTFTDRRSMWIEVLPVPSSGSAGTAGDGDGDGAADGRDNCPHRENPDQDDTDRDGRGDACSTAGRPREAPEPEPAPGPAPEPGPTAGPAPEATPAPTEPDRDRDGIPTAVDVCPDTVDPAQEDTDGDGRGDACTDPVPAPVVHAAPPTKEAPAGLWAVALLAVLVARRRA